MSCRIDKKKVYKKLHMTRPLPYVICIGRVWSRDHYIAYLTYLVYQFIEWENSLTPGSTLVIPVFVRTSTVSPSFNPTGCEAALKLTKVGTKRYMVWMQRTKRQWMKCHWFLCLGFGDLGRNLCVGVLGDCILSLTFNPEIMMFLL